MKRLFLVCLCCLYLMKRLNAEDAAVTPNAIPESADPVVVPAVEEKYANELSRAEAILAKANADFAKSQKTAADARLKAYGDKLVEATKAGNFDKAVGIKSRLTTLEKDPGRTPIKRQPPAERVKFDGHLYAVINESVTWHVAKKRCEEMGGHLICIGTDKEKLFALELCKSKGVQTCWAGATDEESEGHWKWVDGSDVRVSGRNIDNELNAEHYLVIAVFLGNVTDSLSSRTSYLCEWEP